jgi:hypothetical protein
MSLVVRSRTIPPYAFRKMPTKLMGPQSDRFTADDHTSLRKQDLNFGGAHGEAVAGPYSVSNDLTRIAEAL